MNTENIAKFVSNLHDEKEYFFHTRSLKQALNHRLILKKSAFVIKFKIG